MHTLEVVACASTTHAPFAWFLDYTMRYAPLQPYCDRAIGAASGLILEIGRT